MDEREAIYRTILNDPDGDAPRLVFADWLEEHGDLKRAEFIRVQCQIEHELEYSALWKKLERRQNTLLKAHKKEWTQTTKGMAVFSLLKRGFIEKVTMLASKFLDRGELLFSMEPVTEVKFVYREEEPIIEAAPRLAESELLSRLRGLDFDNVPFGPAALDRLLESKHLGRLTTLRFGFAGANVITTSAIGRLLHAAQTPNLTTLDIRNMRSDGNGFAVGLQRGSRTEGLQVLRLRDCELRHNELNAIAGGKRLRSLRHLYIENRRMPNGFAGALPGPSLLSQLNHLALYGCAIGATGAVEMARSSMKQLSHLTLSRCAIEDAGAIALTESPSLHTLRCLNLSANRITNRGAEAIRKSQALSGLVYLNLGANLIDDDEQKLLRDRFGKGVCTFAN